MVSILVGMYLTLAMAAAADLRFGPVTVSFNKQRAQYHQNNADKSVFGNTWKTNRDSLMSSDAMHMYRQKAVRFAQTQPVVTCPVYT